MPRLAKNGHPSNDGDTADRILIAAGQLFRERGYAGTSVKQIASKVGISTPALYWHFASKDDLFFRYLERTLVAFRDSIRDAVEPAPEEAKLHAFIAAYISFQLGAREVAEAYTEIYGLGQMLDVLSEERRSRLLAIQREVLNMLRGVLERGRKAGRFTGNEDLTVTAFAIITLCEHVNTWYRPDGRFSIAAVTEQYQRLVDGLVNSPPDDSLLSGS